MIQNDIEVQPRAGLLNLADIFVAPSAAFARIRVVPVWLWACLAACVLGIIGSVLSHPATAHALAVSLPIQDAANPAFAKMTPEQQSEMVQKQLGFLQNFWIVSAVLGPVIFVFLNALIQGALMTAGVAMARGRASFKRNFAASMTVSVIGLGLALLVQGIIAILRGPDSFNDAGAIPAALPGLGFLASHGFARGFLAGINVFNLWATYLIAVGLTITGDVRKSAAWTISGVLFVLYLLFLGVVSIKS